MPVSKLFLERLLDRMSGSKLLNLASHQLEQSFHWILLREKENSLCVHQRLCQFSQNVI